LCREGEYMDSIRQNSFNEKSRSAGLFVFFVQFGDKKQIRSMKIT
jgi:hypothetical protein